MKRFFRPEFVSFIQYIVYSAFSTKISCTILCGRALLSAGPWIDAPTWCQSFATEINTVYLLLHCCCFKIWYNKSITGHWSKLCIFCCTKNTSFWLLYKFTKKELCHPYSNFKGIEFLCWENYSIFSVNNLLEQFP